MLPNTVSGKNVKFDNCSSIPMHDFADKDSWVNGPDDSIFTMQPADNEIWEVKSVRVRYSVNADFHCPLTVKYYVYGVPNPVRTTIYKNTNDFMGRCDDISILEVAGNGPYEQNIFNFIYNFKEPITLYGLNVQPISALSHFTMGIDDNLPLTAISGGPMEMVEVRYPDVSVYKIT